MIDWILSQAVGSWTFIVHMGEWAAQYPGAALFWATFWSVLIDWAVTKSPWGWDDMIWKAIKTAIAEAVRTALPSGRGGAGGRKR